METNNISTVYFTLIEHSVYGREVRVDNLHKQIPQAYSCDPLQAK